MSMSSRIKFAESLTESEVLHNPHVLKMHSELRQNATFFAMALANAMRWPEEQATQYNHLIHAPRLRKSSSGSTIPSSESDFLATSTSAQSEDLQYPPKHCKDANSSNISIHNYPQSRRPASRPGHYPSTVNWTKQAAIERLGLKGSSNESRINMRVALTHPNGEVVTPHEYDAIFHSVAVIINELLRTPRNANDHNADRTLTYFAQNHKLSLIGACCKLEDEQQLVSLCTGYWKAQELIKNALRNANKKGKVKANNPPPSRKRTSGHAPPSDRPSKQTKITSSNQNPFPGAISPAPPAGSEEVHVGLSSKSPLDTIVSFTDNAPTRPTWDQLIETVKNEQPKHFDVAEELFSSIRDNTQTRLDAGVPSEDFSRFLNRIQDADPGSPGYEKDDLGEGWGHSQFTAVPLTCDTVLHSWDSFGNTSSAAAILAATLKTSRIARKYCAAHNINPPSYLADTYFGIVLEKLKDAWTTASAIGAATPQSEDAGSSGPPGIEGTELKELLDLLTPQQLKGVMTRCNISNPGVKATKPTLVLHLLSRANQISPEQLAYIQTIAEQKTQAKAKKSKSRR